MVKERLTTAAGDLRLLRGEELRRVFPDAFNFAKREQRPGSVFVTSLRFVFVSYFKVFSLSLPFFQVRKAALQKGSARRAPLLLLSLHPRLGKLKLAFGVSPQHRGDDLDLQPKVH